MKSIAFHVNESKPSAPAVRDRLAALARSLGMDALHPHFTELLVPDEAKKAHELGLMVNVWTVNEEEHIRYCLKAGADILISNYPDRALKVREALEG